MSFGTVARFRKSPLPHSPSISLILLLAVFICNEPMADDEVTFERLMNIRATETVTRARFKQTVVSAFATEPLSSEGVLHYVSPDYFSLKIDSPLPFHAEITDGKIAISRGKNQHSVDTDQYPGFASYLKPIVWFLQGDRESFALNYDNSMSGELDSWRLVLTPLQDSEISSIEISGSSENMQSMNIDKTFGDKVLLQITDTRIAN